MVRQGPRGVPELLFVRRPDSMRFLGGFHAFIGGALDEGDSSQESISAADLAPDKATEILGDAAGGLPAIGFFICAVRELFEEVGVLLTSDGSQFDASEFEEARRELLQDRVSIGEVASRLGVTLGTDKLRFHSRWVAPKALPIRFDVRVFLTLDSGNLDPDPREVDRVQWMSAPMALALAEAGEILMAPPTVATVSALMPYQSVDELLKGERAITAPKIEVHSPLVRRIVAPNASIMTGPGTNSWIVGTKDVIVIDPGSMEPEHVEGLANSGDVRTVLLTHHHPDHISGALELAEMTGAELASSSMFFSRSAMSGRGLEEGDLITVPGATLEVFDTPGHAFGHISLLLREEQALFTGDLILGEGTPVISPPDGDLIQYMESLDKMIDLEPARLYPGHFDPRDDAREWMAWYKAHRLERESEILRVLEKRSSIPEIVEIVYAGYPEALHPIAERTVLAHLLKLVNESRAVQEGDDFKIPQQ
jgi:glyoxylase-like metal-dependent hydrolase (beta-lactamase superfamily II)/8-oxo-dGTP pyrophosphatase MutT (NUDIX family)